MAKKRAVVKKATKKSTKKAEPSVDAIGTKLNAPVNGVAIRMYRQGLGDCFLLAFPADNAGDNSRYVLIDCGVLNGQPQGAARLRLVMDNVRKATDGQLHVVVATHEHADHLSGFKDKQGIFFGPDRIPVDELWLAWTEDPEDKQVDVVKARKNAASLALGGLVAHLASPALAHRPMARAILGMMKPIAGFGDFRMVGAISDDIDDGGDPAAASGMMDTVKGITDNVPKYFKPGKKTTIPGAKGIEHRVYVLGPPCERELLRGEGRADREDAVYFGDSSNSLAFLAALTSYVAAVENTPDAGPLKDDFAVMQLVSPFPNYARPLRPTSGRNSAWTWKDLDAPPVKKEQTSQVPDATKAFFQDRYGISHRGNHKSAWRAIDYDWLVGSQLLGLKIGSDTNNTSLALAFELGPPGKGPVLLFPGDAQVGNWWSWRDRFWQVGGRKIDAADLLARTRVYKVGHHASHNGTVMSDQNEQPWGLEMMPDDLVALIPVDETTARKTGGKDKKWDMPAAKLYQRLKEKTGGRILRSDSPPYPKPADGHTPVVRKDQPLDGPETDAPSAIPGLPDMTWAKGPLIDGDTEDPLYYDLTLTLNDA